MKKLSSLAAATAALLFVATCVGLMTSSPVVAQGRPETDVNVVNSPTVNVGTLPAIQVSSLPAVQLDPRSPVALEKGTTDTIFLTTIRVNGGSSVVRSFDVSRYEKVRVCGTQMLGDGYNVTFRVGNEIAWLGEVPNEGSLLVDVPGQSLRIRLSNAVGNPPLDINVAIYGR